jgi:hypothetical protein
MELVEAVRDLPYGRPSDRTVSAMLRERRGTFPETDPRIVHRVYRLDRARARELFGVEVASIVPDGGLIDVHRFLTMVLVGRRVELDATFAGEPWDGRSALAAVCGDGADYLAGDDPDSEKRALESANCDPEIREPFIAALGRTAPRITKGISST